MVPWTFSEALADPHAAHAVFVHAPIALIPAAAATLLAFLITGARVRTLAIVAVALLAVAAAGAGLAAGAGEEAIILVERDAAPLTEAELAALDRHEEMGEGGWMWPAAAAAVSSLVLLPAGKRRWQRPAAGTLGLVAAGVATAWAVRTGHSGGEIVYRHGLGTPERAVTAD